MCLSGNSQNAGPPEPDDSFRRRPEARTCSEIRRPTTTRLSRAARPQRPGTQRAPARNRLARANGTRPPGQASRDDSGNIGQFRLKLRIPYGKPASRNPPGCWQCMHRRRRQLGLPGKLERLSRHARQGHRLRLRRPRPPHRHRRDAAGRRDTGRHFVSLVRRGDLPGARRHQRPDTQLLRRGRDRTGRAYRHDGGPGSSIDASCEVTDDTSGMPAYSQTRYRWTISTMRSTAQAAATRAWEKLRRMLSSDRGLNSLPGVTVTAA